MKKFAAICMLAALLLSGCHAGESENAMPVTLERVKSVVSEYDAVLTVAEDGAFQDGQTSYTLTDGNGQTTAYLTSVGEGSQGALNLLLMRSEQRESKLYDYGTVIPLAVKLFDPALDGSKIYSDFASAWEKGSDSDWTNTYGTTTVYIEVTVEAPVEMRIVLYNSEKYNPFPREANPEDYFEINPDVTVSEITGEQFRELLGSKDSGSDNEKYYKITVNDQNYHAKFKVDLTLLLKINLQESKERLDYAGVIWNSSSEEYAFQDVVGYCLRDQNEVEAVMNIPIVDVMEKNVVQYKERFDYKVLINFSLEDLEDVQVSAFDESDHPISVDLLVR